MTLVDDLIGACYYGRIEDVKRLVRDEHADVNATNLVCVCCNCEWIVQ